MTYRMRGRQYVVIAAGGPGTGAKLLAFALSITPGVVQAPPSLPGGEGPVDVERACSQCHSFDIVARSRHTRKQWEAQIDSMIAKGARISDEDFDVVADYLVSHFGFDGGR